jgi:hypothetical protein
MAEEFHPTVWNDAYKVAISPRPGLWLGTCQECEEWRPLMSAPFPTPQLADTWEIDGVPVKVNWEIEKDIPIVIDIDYEPYTFCLRCWVAEDQEEDEDELYDYDPESLPEEVRQRIKQERKAWKRELKKAIRLNKYRIPLQCAAITTRGHRCKNKGWGHDYINDPFYSDKPFADPHWWLCNRHIPVCPHCDFASEGKLPGAFRLELCLLYDEVGDATSKGLSCLSCFCTFDPRLDLVESGDPCTIWGRGPRPGTFGARLVHEPEVIAEAAREAAEYTTESVRKHKRLKEWRKQLQQDQEDGG